MDLTSYQTLFQQATDDPESFWGNQAKKYLAWFSEWEKVLSGSLAEFNSRWFQGGKLNAAYNCLDRHLEKRANQIAIIWESNDGKQSKQYTYQELFAAVSRFANVLKQLGIKKGDKIAIYLPMIPEAVIAMLASARIGAVHSVVFAGFSAPSLKTRIEDADCKLVITANEGLRGNKKIPLKETVDEALTDCANVANVIVVKHTDAKVAWNNTRDHWYHDLLQQVKPDCEPEIMDAEDPLFILYTSGSTGKPKGILHGTAGYLLYTAITFQTIFDYQEKEIYWCTADVGWITGHSYIVYGPLLNGATVLLYEGIPSYPTFSSYWEIIDKYKVNIFYTSPTAIRALRKEGDDWVNKTSRKSLRILGSVGEPINPEAWQWYHDVVGESRAPIVDTWWQTETGGIMISPIPNATPLKAGSAAWPFFGVQAKIVDDHGKALPKNTLGRLVIDAPWPGMMQTVYGDRERFQKYFTEIPNHYDTGDLAEQDADGYFWIAGRSDDAIKVSGHRLGTQEIESAILLNAAVSEAAVVPVPDEIKGQHIYAFVTLKTGFTPTSELKKSIIETVRHAISPIAAPDEIQWAEQLPKTRSGKIMRRLLKKIAQKETDALGDLSTLADSKIVEDLIRTEKNLETDKKEAVAEMKNIKKIHGVSVKEISEWKNKGRK